MCMLYFRSERQEQKDKRDRGRVVRQGFKPRFSCSQLAHGLWLCTTWLNQQVATTAQLFLSQLPQCHVSFIPTNLSPHLIHFLTQFITTTHHCLLSLFLLPSFCCDRIHVLRQFSDTFPKQNQLFTIPPSLFKQIIPFIVHKDEYTCSHLASCQAKQREAKFSLCPLSRHGSQATQHVSSRQEAGPSRYFLLLQ